MANQTTVVLSLVDAQLFRGNSGSVYPLPAQTLCNTVENVSVKVTLDQATANNRNTPIKQQLPSLVDIEIEINFPSDSADTHLSAFRSALIGRQAIPVSVRDGAGFNFSAAMGVFGADNDQQLAGVPMTKFTLRPWAVGASGTQPSFS
jgi:hypothetical protein